jgi:hypothetical protein
MKILITEQEKNEILNKHKNFKKILENELSKLNRGLVIEQDNNEKVVIDLDSAKKNGCLTNGNFDNRSGKRVWIKKAKNANPGKFEIGDEIVQYGDGTYEVYSPTNPSTPKGKFKWRCPDNKSKYELDREKTDAAVETFLNQFRPNVDGCVKMIERFYETWENDVTNMDEQLFNQLKSETQTCANYFNGSWKGKLGRGPVRKKIELLQGGIGGTESSSKWRLLTPRNFKDS